MKAARIPRRIEKRLTDAERCAVDELRFSQPGAARRGELKTELGWKRTREETVALAHDQIEKGMIIAAVAAHLDVDARYLRTLLKEDPAADSVPGKPSSHAGESATNVRTPGGESSRGSLPAPACGFASFAHLDAWLEERGR